MIAKQDMKAHFNVSQKAQQNDHKDMTDNACIKYGIRQNTTHQMVKKAGLKPCTDVLAPRTFLPHDRLDDSWDQAALLPPDMLYPVDMPFKNDSSLDSHSPS